MEPAQNIGNYFRYALDGGGSLSNDRPGLDRGIKHHSHSNASVQLTTQANGAGPGTPWNFRFLKYWSGAITRCGIGNGVLTGPFTGCFVCRFTNVGGVSVAHVGTADSPTEPKTVAVKTDWTAYKTSKQNGNFVGRKPTDVITDLDVSAEIMNAMPTNPQKWGVWAFIRQQDAWALLIHEGNNNVNQIIRARPMVLLPWASAPGSW
ncbi:MAG: hypothetical protein ACPG51_10505 [Thiolinea sp.]